MKKSLWLLLFLMLVCLFSFSACDDTDQPQTPGGDHVHAFGEWTTVKDATCTVNGLQERICSCSEKETKSIDATGHTEVIDAAVASTCTTEGKTEGRHCSSCGIALVEQVALPLADHTYDNENDEKCNVCGQERDAECAHAETETVKGYAATCTATGLTDGKRCALCREILLPQEVIPTTAHTVGEWTTITAATCTASGVEKKLCSICGAIEDVRITPLAAHTPGDWKVTEAATCTTSGVEKRICTACNATTDMRTTPLTPHTYTQYEYTEIKHWKKCANCTATLEKEAHAISSDGSCVTCGSKNASTEGIVYDISDDGTYAIVADYIGASTKVKIAETYNGLPVKEIAGYAFLAKGISSVFIPDSVTSIGGGAFSGCTRLKSVTIGTGITYMGTGAFSGCENLESVYITDLGKWCAIDFGSRYFDHSPLCNGADLYLNGALLTELVIPDSITDIGFAFADCTSLTSVTIPNSITDIGYEAFAGCTNLRSIVIPDSVRTIDLNAFAGCTSLTSITIPDSVTSIGSETFYGCESLSSITIPDSVTSIGRDAFSYCTSLSSVTIPDSVTSIGDYAFSSCDSLSSVTIPDSVTSIGSYAFRNCTSLTSIQFSGTVEQWKAISRGLNWNYEVPTTKVVCKDGEVAI